MKKNMKFILFALLIVLVGCTFTPKQTEPNHLEPIHEPSVDKEDNQSSHAETISHLQANSVVIASNEDYTIHENLYDTCHQPFFEDRYAGLQGITFHASQLQALNEQLLQAEIDLFEANGNDFILEYDENDPSKEWASFTSQVIECHSYQDTLSVIVKQELHANHVGGDSLKYFDTYNIDLTTGTVLDNFAFLEHYDIALEDLQQRLYQQLNDAQEMYQDETDLSFHQILGAAINENTRLFMDENGKINVILTTNNENMFQSALVKYIVIEMK